MVLPKALDLPRRRWEVFVGVATLSSLVSMKAHS
jgi:hypothetical protein